MNYLMECECEWEFFSVFFVLMDNGSHNGCCRNVFCDFNIAESHI